MRNLYGGVYMFGLIYKSLTYFFSGSALNKGERDQPAPLASQEAHLLRELARVRREKEVVAGRLAEPQDPGDDPEL